MVKKAPYQPDDDSLAKGRNELLSREERDMFFDVGFFVAEYAAVELGITYILARATGFDDLRPFELLSRGMDAKVKLRSLRQAAKLMNGIGPNLGERLSLFEDGAIPLRNKLMHNSLTYNEDDGPRTYYLASVANPPWRELKMPKRAHPTHPPDRIRSVDLYAWGLWLSNFALDLVPVQPQARTGARLEIDHPKSLVRQADH